jgi:hypothetical protein
MEGLSKQQIAMASYEWGEGNRDKKVRLYNEYPHCRSLFLQLPGDCFFLLERLDSSLWSELVQLDYHVLNRDSERSRILTNVLQTLSAEDAIKAFHEMQQCSTRKAVMNNLTSESRVRVETALTQASIQRIEEARKDPQDENHVMATKGFLETLDSSARTCSSKRCVGRSLTPLKEYTVFSLARCLRHSFHLACIERDHDCGVNRLNSERDRVDEKDDKVQDANEDGPRHD